LHLAVLGDVASCLLSSILTEALKDGISKSSLPAAAALLLVISKNALGSWEPYKFSASGSKEKDNSTLVTDGDIVHDSK